jgi:hypothetical protein
MKNFLRTLPGNFVLIADFSLAPTGEAAVRWRHEIALARLEYALLVIGLVVLTLLVMDFNNRMAALRRLTGEKR